jgi:hypothetical protein
MIHDPDLLDRLADLPTESFRGEVFRATRLSLDPLAASGSGGRWGPTGGPNVLYTSLLREGALAEISFHWALQTPRPSRPAVVHTLRVTSPTTLRLIRADIAALGVSATAYEQPNLPRTQEIGAAIEFLGYDGLIAPCARWACNNLILFPDSASFAGSLEAIGREEVDWLTWAKAHGLIDDV